MPDNKQIYKKLISYTEQNKDKKVSLDYFAVSLPNLLIFETDLNLIIFIVFL